MPWSSLASSDLDFSANESPASFLYHLLVSTFFPLKSFPLKCFFINSLVSVGLLSIDFFDLTSDKPWPIDLPMLPMAPIIICFPASFFLSDHSSQSLGLRKSGPLNSIDFFSFSDCSFFKDLSLEDRRPLMSFSSPSNFSPK